MKMNEGRARLEHGLRRLVGDVSVERRKSRKPSIRRMVAAAEKAGKTVTSVTTPEGITLRFDQPEPTEARNPWLADLKVTKQ